MASIQTETMLAYLAGIVDGEGTIGIYEVAPQPPRRVSPQHKLYMSVGMTDHEIPALFKEIFGGALGVYHYNRERDRPFSKWHLWGKNASACCEALLPYLRVKRPQAELAIKFQAERFSFNRRSKGLPEGEVELRRATMATMRALNQRMPLREVA